MPPLFEVNAVDRAVYQDQLRSFLPGRLIDIHAHVWLDQFQSKERDECSAGRHLAPTRGPGQFD